MTRALTPIEQAIEQAIPSTVTYDIRVVWPSGEISTYATGQPLNLERAAETLEVLVEELREAVT